MTWLTGVALRISPDCPAIWARNTGCCEEYGSLLPTTVGDAIRIASEDREANKGESVILDDGKPVMRGCLIRSESVAWNWQ